MTTAMARTAHLESLAEFVLSLLALAAEPSLRPSSKQLIGTLLSTLLVGSSTLFVRLLFLLLVRLLVCLLATGVLISTVCNSHHTATGWPVLLPPIGKLLVTSQEPAVLAFCFEQLRGVAMQGMTK